jgi:hypothetical protein
MVAAGQLPFATTFFSPLGRGGSKAQLLGFDDGINRVVKFPNNPQGVRTLANELVSARLASLIGVPVPSCGIVEVTNSFVNAEPTLSGLEAGLCFGSEYHKAVDVSGPSEIWMASNREELAGIVLFDSWCNNVDRAHNPGNLILTAGEQRILAIDHGFCFGYQWDKHINEIGQPVSIICRSDFREFVALKHFDPFIERIKGVTEAELHHIVDQVPREWQVSCSERVALVKYVQSRIEGCIQAIMNDFH